jgi:hypothetical protein
MNGPSLKERFASFMASDDFAEDIDALVRSGYPDGLQKADYLVNNRSVIVEQKSLDEDVDAKVQALLDELIGAYGPLDRKQVTLAGIIDTVAQLPRGNPFKPKLRAILTQRIDDILAKADKQTRDTRKFFSLPTAIGAVVVLNECAPLIEPDYFQDKAYDMLRKELVPGQLRYLENQVVILISEAHRVVTALDQEEIPVETAISDAGRENPAVEAFAAEFRRRWAEFNGAIAIELAGVLRDVTTRDPARLFKA